MTTKDNFKDKNLIKNYCNYMDSYSPKDLGASYKIIGKIRSYCIKNNKISQVTKR